MISILEVQVRCLASYCDLTAARYRHIARPRARAKGAHGHERSDKEARTDRDFEGGELKISSLLVCATTRKRARDCWRAGLRRFLATRCGRRPRKRNARSSRERGGRSFRALDRSPTRVPRPLIPYRNYPAGPATGAQDHCSVLVQWAQVHGRHACASNETPLFTQRCRPDRGCACFCQS